MKIEIGKTYKFKLCEFCTSTLRNDPKLLISVIAEKGQSIRERLANKAGASILFTGRVIDILHTPPTDFYKEQYSIILESKTIKLV